MRARDKKPTPKERSDLIRKLTGLGYNSEELAAMIRTGRTREEISRDLLYHIQTARAKGLSR